MLLKMWEKERGNKPPKLKPIKPKPGSGQGVYFKLPKYPIMVDNVHSRTRTQNTLASTWGYGVEGGRLRDSSRTLSGLPSVRI